jgi:hypothetical protein
MAKLGYMLDFPSFSTALATVDSLAAYFRFASQLKCREAGDLQPAHW